MGHGQNCCSASCLVQFAGPPDVWAERTNASTAARYLWPCVQVGTWLEIEEYHLGMIDTTHLW